MKTGQYIEDGSSKWIVSDVTDGIPVGDIVYRPYLKDGYVKADGSTVNRADYPRLVALADKYSLWTDDTESEPWKFGNGDKSTTFVLPNYTERFIEGGSSVAVRSAGLPNITGMAFATNAWWGDYPCGTDPSKGAEGYSSFGRALYSVIENTQRRKIGQSSTGTEDQRYFGTHYYLDASKSSSIYGNSSTVQPPAIVLIPQMKY